MIHFALGTQAELIKLAPIMCGLKEQGVPFNFIQTGQHKRRIKELIGFFELPDPSKITGEIENEVETIPSTIKWAYNVGKLLLSRKDSLLRKAFMGARGICVIHGDTLSTLYCLAMAKRAGLKIAHVESGLRSFNYVHPFPEEAIRVLINHHTDLLFAPNKIAEENLKKMRVKGEIVSLPVNTGFDALTYTLKKIEKNPAYSNPYGVVSIHRFENIFLKKRFKKILDFIRSVSEKINILFFIHPVTKKQINKYNFNYIIEREGINCLSFERYPDFIRILRDADFVITDGGSIQEESYYLNIPALLLRKRTERIEGINKTAFITDLEENKMQEFIKYYKNYRGKTPPFFPPATPVIIENIIKYQEIV